MNIFIGQKGGLGDILYCQKIAISYIEKGYDVFWDTIPEYAYINKYLCNGIKWNEKVPSNTRCLDLEKAYRLLNKSDICEIMKSKYEYAGIDGKDWLNYVNISRDIKREECIYWNVIGDTKNYALVCDTYGSPPNECSTVLNIKTDLPLRFIKKNEGDNPFDWMKIIENAKQIHFIDTCFCYIAETMNLKSERNCLYIKRPYYDRHIVKNIRKPIWEYME